MQQRRRCSYLTLDRGTCLAFGWATAQDGRYVTVNPDGGDAPLRLPAAYVDFDPLFDPTTSSPRPPARSSTASG